VNGITSLESARFYEGVTSSASGPSPVMTLRNLRLFGSVQHSGGTLTVKLISKLGENNQNEAIGFREFNALFVQTSSPPANSMCGTGPDGATFPEQCPCPEGYYGTSSSSCAACHANCASCYGAGANQCYQCASGNSLVGTTCTTCYKGCNFCTGSAYNQCVECSSGYFLLNGNQCVLKCDLPLVQGADTYGCVATCSSPCTTSTDFLYWDGTCSSSCPSPLAQSIAYGSINMCKFPCADGQYLYGDGSCSATCTSPRVAVDINSQQLCSDLCPVGQYLYWNGTCHTECTYPLTQQASYNQILCQYSCSPTQYLSWDGACLTSCPYPLTTRIENGYQFCDFPLEDVTQYLYYNGSSAATCPSPLSSSTQGTNLIRKFCDYPCAASKYLYANGTCGDFCNYPMSTDTYGGKQFCNNPCGFGSSDFLYWNGSCISSCDSPYYQRLEPGVNYCDYSCGAGLYYYWDGTCVSSCKSPLKIYTAGTTDSQYCVYSCASSKFLYWNGTCKDSCDFPLTQTTVKSKQFCNYPCAQHEFLHYNGTCSDNCLSPLVQERVNEYGFCNYPCKSSEYLFWNGSCITSCLSPLTIQTGSYGEKSCQLPCSNELEYYILETKKCVTECDQASRIQNDLYLRCMSPNSKGYTDLYAVEDPGLVDLLLITQGNADGFSLISMTKLSGYVRYLDIDNMPSRLDEFATSKTRSFLSPKFHIPMAKSVQNSFPYRSVYSLYERRNLHSSFFINYWDNLTTLGGVVSFGLLVLFLSIIAIKAQADKLAVFLVELRSIFLWNVCIMLLVVNADEIFTYFFVDLLSSMTFSLASAIISLCLGLVFIGAFLIILFATYTIVRKSYLTRGEVQDTGRQDLLTQFINQNKGWQIMYYGYSETTIGKYFYLIYSLRYTLPAIYSLLFMKTPVTQTVFNMITTLAMIQFILLASPLKKSINKLQLLIVEGIVLVINFSSIMLAAYDSKRSHDVRGINMFGDLIIIGNFMINLVLIIFLPVKLALEAFEIYKYQRNSPKKNHVVWLRLLTVPLQQFGFGFEEIVHESAYTIAQIKFPKASQIHTVTETVKENQEPVPVVKNPETANPEVASNKNAVERINRLRNLQKRSPLLKQSQVLSEEQNETEAISPMKSPERKPSSPEEPSSPILAANQSHANSLLLESPANIRSRSRLRRNTQQKNNDTSKAEEGIQQIDISENTSPIQQEDSPKQESLLMDHNQSSSNAKRRLLNRSRSPSGMSLALHSTPSIEKNMKVTREDEGDTESPNLKESMRKSNRTEIKSVFKLF